MQITFIFLLCNCYVGGRPVSSELYRSDVALVASRRRCDGILLYCNVSLRCVTLNCRALASYYSDEVIWFAFRRVECMKQLRRFSDPGRKYYTHPCQMCQLLFTKRRRVDTMHCTA